VVCVANIVRGEDDPGVFLNSLLYVIDEIVKRDGVTCQRHNVSEVAEIWRVVTTVAVPSAGDESFSDCGYITPLFDASSDKLLTAWIGKCLCCDTKIGFKQVNGLIYVLAYLLVTEVLECGIPGPGIVSATRV